MSDSEIDDYGMCEGSEIKCNHLYLDGEINKDSVYDLLTEIDKITYDIIKTKFRYDIKELAIYLHINTNGGDLHQAFRVVDKILRNEVPVYTIIDGYCASAGTIISIVGKKRFATANSYLLIHQLSTSHGGKLVDLKDGLKNAKNIDKRVRDLYLRFTKINQKKLESKLKRELEFDVNEAMELGFIDSIY